MNFDHISNNTIYLLVLIRNLYQTFTPRKKNLGPSGKILTETILPTHFSLHFVQASHQRGSGSQISMYPVFNTPLFQVPPGSTGAGRYTYSTFPIKIHQS